MMLVVVKGANPESLIKIGHGLPDKVQVGGSEDIEGS